MKAGDFPGLMITSADRRAYNEHVEVQDMENINYPDNTFDLVVCVNALDHTEDAEKALKELIRVARTWVYVDCSLIQKSSSGKGHYWDMQEDGTMTDGERSFNIGDYGFKIELIDNRIGRRYDHVICSYTKP